MALSVSFFGGAGTVTGSKYLVEDGHHRILIDCGLFQGFKSLRLRNWSRLPVDPHSIDAVILTHAHLDHTGYLPLLVKNGFRGPVYCSASTLALCGILLPDSGHLQEADANYANYHGFSKHKPALPLYTEKDARRALKALVPVAFDEQLTVVGNIGMRLRRMGHILGAASVTLACDQKTIVFSGDIGRYGDEVMLDPVSVDQADWLIVESTYGDRCHDRANADDALATIVSKTLHRGGTVLVPAYAVGRSQSVFFHLEKLRSNGRLPAAVPIFLDSPMAIDASDILYAHPADHRLSQQQCRALQRGVHYVRTGEESSTLTANPMPKIIISASGMATGGRVLHHLKHYAPDSRNTILFTGFQPGGTRSAAMVAGATEVKIHGRYIPIRAEVRNLEMLSAHADRDEILRWLGGFKRPPKTTFVTHGEPAAADALRHKIEEYLRWACTVPDQGDRIELS